MENMEEQGELIIMKNSDTLGDAETGLIDARRRRSSNTFTHSCSSAGTGVSTWRALRGPCRLIRLCILGLFTPALLISVPLYMRYHVLYDQQYPVALSDVRLLDRSISTTWCQRQIVSGNASFNAYLVPEAPRYGERPERVGMTRHLVLSDDMKEYWGFYLLPGSEVHISACSRWPGASLIVIRGHKHLRDCAYIGDDSSEEADELAEIEREKSLQNRSSHTSPQRKVDDSEIESSTRGLKLGRPKPLPGKSYDDSVRYELLSTTSEPDGTLSTSKPHTVTTSEEAMDELWVSVKKLGDGGRRALRKLAARLDDEASEISASSTEELSEVTLLRRLVQQLLRESKQRHLRQRQQQTEQTSETKKRGSRHLGVDEGTQDGDAMEVAQLRALLLQEVHRQLTNNSTESRIRARRDLSKQLAGELSEEPEPEENAAVEEGLNPDGIADHRGKINETTSNDRSNEEFWSSFSSSEEALMNCEGLILYLPLTARQSCNQPSSAKISNADTFSYIAPSSGYYFFVFSSENEIQPNLISVRFSLVRTVYNVSDNVSKCDNSTSCSFSLDFFSSEKVVLEVPVSPEKEEPSPEDSADTISKHWNEEYLVVSTCEPRTSIYLVCVILVPIFIMMFALQKL